MQNLQQQTTSNITPFTAKGDFFIQQETEQPEPIGQEPEENNRKRHFRAIANYCELASGSVINTTICFTFRAIGVSTPGYFVALVITHCYFTATAASDQRRVINHIMTGIASSAGTLATLAEPISNAIESSSAQTEFYSDLKSLQPKQTDSSTWIWIAIAALAALCFGATITKSNKGIRR
jgi:hypothetical protein